MITASEVLTHIVALPFRAFRVRIAGGQTFDICEPEAVQVGRSALGIRWRQHPHASEEWRQIPLTLIESVELNTSLGEKPQLPLNGAPAREQPLWERPPVEWVAAWDLWCDSHAHTSAHFVDDSRESIYAGRGD